MDNGFASFEAEGGIEDTMDLNIGLDISDASGNPPGVGHAWFKAGMIFSQTFFGAPIRIVPETGAASYFSGAINISLNSWKEFLTGGLNSHMGYLLMHEYGHYLESKYAGSIVYNLSHVPANVYNFLTDGERHEEHWSEIQASILAYYYFGKPAGSKESNIVNDLYVDKKYLNQLYNEYENHPDYRQN